MLIIYNFPSLMGLICSACLSGILLSAFPHMPPGLKDVMFALPLALIGFGTEMAGVRAHIYYVRLYIIGSLFTLLTVYQGYGALGLTVTCGSILTAFLLSRIFNETKRWGKAQKALASYYALEPGNGDMREHHLLEALFMNRWLPGTHSKIEHNRTVIERFLNDRELALSPPEMQVLEATRANMEKSKPVLMGWKLNHIAPLQKHLDNLRQSRGIGRLAMG